MKKLAVMASAICLSVGISVSDAAPLAKSPNADDHFPPLPWTDFYGTEHSAAIPDAVRSYMIAKQVCHYFSTLYSNRFGEAEYRYIEANIKANCTGLESREKQLQVKFADNPIAMSAIRRQIAALGKPQP
ncbi:hypothetical protein [Parasphingorhabdus cellanae]|uniref:Uncharacterized protein n=1 Tax=Parasphingorhabdus cellanae TaxID=2806553 RepID=A0ABX7T4H0_9SPHN|nr:hypothetical protein [Parasphingorhabdus cellanae]QTD55394.1 hypothetical protein J4G78_14455 [Parasphingorhabdus cellanae]